MSEPQPGLALFDFDGTVTHTDSFATFLHYAVKPPRRWLGQVLVAPLVFGYRKGWISASWLRAVVVWLAFRGMAYRTLARCGIRYADTVLPTLVRPQMLERIQAHLARGDEVVVVSASLDLYLRHWCRRHGVGVLCSSLAQFDGVVTGRYCGPQCAGARKAKLVRKHHDLRRYQHIYAYGDTVEDLELLALADEAYYNGVRASVNLDARQIAVMADGAV